MCMKRVFVVIGLVAILPMLMMSTNAQAGSEWPAVPPGATMSEEEFWAEVVFYCNQGFAVIRAKKVVDCVVETDSAVYTSAVNFLCPSNERQVTGVQMQGVTLFGDPRTPVVTMVKHFVIHEGTVAAPELVSFDAQVKYLE